VVLVLASSCAGLTGEPSTPAGLEERVRTATTPEDHLAVAKLYREKAGEARQAAEEHLRLAQRYAQVRKRFGKRKQWHCQLIAARQQEITAGHDALAELHEAEAKRRDLPL
jgi:hypothetical protein